MRVAIIEDEPEISEIIAQLCLRNGHEICEYRSGEEFLKALRVQEFELILADHYLAGMNGLDTLKNALKLTPQLPYWVFVSGSANIELAEIALRLHPIDLLRKPFSAIQFNAMLDRHKHYLKFPLEVIYQNIQTLSGVRLNHENRTGLESRLMRRARAKGFQAVEDYVPFFNANRATEIEIILGILTTHTTSFFREPEHFQFLEKEILPDFLNRKTDIKIWSAACSTGQEAYTIAIICQEFLSKHVNSKKFEFSVLGSDIDKFSVETAQEGIYPATEIETLLPHIKTKYFKKGQQELSHLFRTNENIWKHCQFVRHNLLSEMTLNISPDIVFLRNVLIYFSKDDIKLIVASIAKMMSPGAYLVVGHSEAAAISHPLFHPKAPGVFQMQDGEFRKTELPSMPCLIAIGSSTGGTQALRSVLAHLQGGPFPPVLVAQHFAEAYSENFASHLAASLGVKVKIAHNNDELLNNHVYVCPGGHHMAVNKRMRIEITKADAGDSLTPEINRLFHSLAQYALKTSVFGLVLTGMGIDGAMGLLEMRKSIKDIITVAESEESAIVYGMPKAAVENGAAMRTMALPMISLFLRRWISEKMK